MKDHYFQARGEHAHSVFDCSTTFLTYPEHKGQHRRAITGPGDKAGHQQDHQQVRSSEHEEVILFIASAL